MGKKCLELNLETRNLSPKYANGSCSSIYTLKKKKHPIRKKWTKGLNGHLSKEDTPVTI